MLEPQIEVDVAERLEREGRLREAADAWAQLAKRDHNASFLVNAAVLAKQDGDHEVAERLFREAIEMDSSCAEAYFQLGLHVEGDGRLEEARELLEQGLRLVERQPILTILGSVQRRLHDSTAAKLSLTRAIELDSLDAEASYGLGLVFADTDPAEAILHLRRALEIDPNVPHANTELGFALFALRRFEEAGAALRLAVAQNPSDAWAHEELGHVLGRSGEWALAKDEYEHATALEPRNGLFWCHLADSCFQLGKSSEADEHYKRALELGLDDAYSYARYANFLRATGRLTTAKQYFRRALQLDSSIRQAKNALAELEADEA